nr:hypothetical protein [uncultured Dyadobacter sp.]
MATPQTIEELRQWLEDHCYSDHHYAIGDRFVHEGCGLRQVEEHFIWYYTERGREDILKTFDSEPEAVAYAWQAIKGDPFASSHLVGIAGNAVEEEVIIRELAIRNITFWKDSIPYGGPGDRRTRIFVRGCDIRKVMDLRAKYGLTD